MTFLSNASKRPFIGFTLSGFFAIASILEDKIDGNQVDYGKASISSLLATATFGFSKYGADKITKVVRSNWWNRGNTNSFVKYLGKNPTTHVGQVVDRFTDVAALGTGLSVDFLFPPISSVKINTGNDKTKNGKKGVVIVHPVEKVPSFE